MEKLIFFFFVLFFKISFSQYSWVQQIALTGAPTNIYDGFGIAVSIYENYTIVGAPGNNLDDGAIYIFSYEGNSWNQNNVQKIQPSNGIYNSFYGNAIAINGNFLLVGAPYASSGNLINEGLVYSLYFDGNSWVSGFPPLVATNASQFSLFGYSVSIYGNYAIIGAYNKTIGNNTSQGAAYIFNFNGNSWIQQQELISSDGATGDNFGFSVAIYGNYAVVGAPQLGGPYSQGNVYFFSFDGNSWIQQQIIYGTSYYEVFGWSVSIYGNYVVVGAPTSFLCQNTNMNNFGCVYIFSYDGYSWNQQGVLNATDGFYFGYSVSIYENYIAVAAPNLTSTNVNQGSAYIFYMVSSTWELQQELFAQNNNEIGWFGYSISIYGNWAAVDFLNSLYQGTVYIFSLVPAQTTQSISTEQVAFYGTKNGSGNAGTIAGGVIGALLGVALIIILVFIVIKWRKRIDQIIKNAFKKNEEHKMEEQKNEEISNETIHQLTNQSIILQPQVKEELKKEFVNPKNTGLLNENLEIIESLGKGSFGEVFKGKLGAFLVVAVLNLFFN